MLSSPLIQGNMAGKSSLAPFAKWHPNEATYAESTSELMDAEFSMATSSDFPLSWNPVLERERRTRNSFRILFFIIFILATGTMVQFV